MKRMFRSRKHFIFGENLSVRKDIYLLYFDLFFFFFFGIIEKF